MPEIEPTTSRPARDANTAGRRPSAHLYLDGVTVAFDGFKALNGLSLIVDKGELRTIIGPTALVKRRCWM